jgi:hypothetical protein
MASTTQVTLPAVPAQDSFIERDIPDDRLDRSEAESDDTGWQDFLTYCQEVRS